MSTSTPSTLNGILLINKGKACTSHKVVHEIRQILNQKAVGHAGTLDPMAEGLLVILCGMATKLSSYFLNNDKRYELTIKFGLETNTFDLDGEVLRSEKVCLKAEKIKELLEKETCDLELSVPIFSAVKVNGKRLYSYAFAGQKISTPIKKMSFYNLEIHNIEKDTVRLSVSCSKGAYIRAWANYLGQKMGTGACLIQLNRTSSGRFLLKNSLTIDELKNKLSKTNSKDLKSLLEDSFLFPSEALVQFSKIELTKKNARFLKQGRIPLWIIEQTQEAQIRLNKQEKSEILKAVREEKLLALLEIRPFEKIRILKNFPHQTI